MLQVFICTGNLLVIFWNWYIGHIDTFVLNMTKLNKPTTFRITGLIFFRGDLKIEKRDESEIHCEVIFF